jgi:hypothetical protein
LNFYASHFLPLVVLQAKHRCGLGRCETVEPPCHSQDDGRRCFEASVYRRWALKNRPAEEEILETDADELDKVPQTMEIILVSRCSNYLIAVDSAKTQ